MTDHEPLAFDEKEPFDFYLSAFLGGERPIFGSESKDRSLSECLVTCSVPLEHMTLSDIQDLTSPPATEEGIRLEFKRTLSTNDGQPDRWIRDPLTAPWRSLASTSSPPRSPNLGLLTAGAEYRWLNGFSLMGKFDSELANRSHTYTGTARLRYTW